jgi:DNA-binding CsgD family transcriptional regulator
LRYYILYYLLFFSSVLFSQEQPPITNYSPKEYNGEYQNWSITQSSSKNIYIANHTSLLEFDGNNWQHYKLPNATIIRSVEAVNNKIYTGSYREFGYWEKNESDELLYTSLSQNLNYPIAEDEDFWDILALDNWVLFQSLDRIYIYDTKEESFKIIEANSEKAKLHTAHNQVYFQIAKKGLFTIKNGEAVQVSSNPVLSNQPIIGIYEWGNEIIILTEDSHFYIYDFLTIRPWNTDLDTLNIKLYSSTKLKNGDFVVGSISDGFYQLSAKGSIKRNINQAKGLNNNTVLFLLEDIDNNLWLGLDNGISVINLYSPFNEYLNNLGNLGLVYTALNHNDYLYLGTNQGLFFKKKELSDQFKLVPGTKGQVWSLQIVHSTLFCGHNKGTFVIKDDTAKLVSDFPGTWGVKPLNNFRDLVLQGNYNGLSILEKKNEEWSLRNIIDGFTISSRFFEIDSLDVVVNHEKKGLYHLTLDNKLLKVLSVDNKLPRGHGSNIFYFKDQLYYKTHNDILNFKQSFNETRIDSNLTSLIFSKNEDPLSIIIPDTIGQKLWYFTKNGIKYITQSTLSGKLSETSISMPDIIRSNLGVAGFENISRIEDNKYLIGSSNGYVTLDLEKVSTVNHKIKLNSVYYGDYQNVTTRTNLNSFGEFESEFNNLKFQYSVPEFDKYTEVKFQYKLAGLLNDWSEFSETPEITFNNLHFGDYVFSVRAKVGSTISENIVSYNFSIYRPWYLSNTSIFVYCLILILLFFTIHKFYKRYYRRKQESIIHKSEKELERRKLEEKEKIAQILNERLQIEIENKNRELAISTMSILKKNKFLYSIKSQLNNILHKEKVAKSVIEAIDHNINSEDDWKFFEDAFNNADKDFLKRIQTKHESLTNNDLRLCAYLRLNLSSKEIAPLLNISVKSVEMKRYRLRKKFGLPHQENLINYILNF